MRYKDFVNYDQLDPYKEECIRRFGKTLVYPNEAGFRIVPETIGETAIAIDSDFFNGIYLAFNVEGLGTKNKIPEGIAEKLKIFKQIANAHGIRHDLDVGGLIRRLFSGIGQDEMAMSFNDLNGIGALPFIFAPIVATGSSNYLTDPDISNGLIDGFETGALMGLSGIPCGETPTLPGVVNPGTIDLAGASLGYIRPKSRLCVGERLTEGLRLYGVGSSGIHSNGLSLARGIAETLPDGYFTRLPSGRTLGEALLTPTTIYSELVRALGQEEADIVYIQLITGHGFGKIMRKKKDLTYVIENVPEPHEEFIFLQKVGKVDDMEAYSVWNMKVGLVLYAHYSQENRIKRACDKSGLPLFDLGRTEKGERKVVIPSKEITYRPKLAA